MREINLGITGLKNPIGDPPLGLWCMCVSIYKFVSTPIFLRDLLVLVEKLLEFCHFCQIRHFTRSAS